MEARRVVFALFFTGALWVVALAVPTTSWAQAQRGYGIDAPSLVAGRDYVASQVIVGLRRVGARSRPPSFTPPAQGQIVGVIHGTAFLLQFPNERAALKAILALLADLNVSFVERNSFMSIPPMPTPPAKNGVSPQVSDPLELGTQAVSTDPGTGRQWHHTVIRKTAALGVLSASPPTIAIIDTGVDYTHSDLAGKVLFGKNCINNTSDPFDDNGHGTHVAGLAAAIAANSRYGEGVSHLSKIYATKALNEFGSGTFFQVACAMHDAHLAVTSPPIRVGNMSIGGPASALIATEVDHWTAAGKVLVVAAGNSDNTGAGTFNTDPDIALRVMATEENDCRTFFSNFSPSATPTLFNIAAPGFETPSTFPDEGFGPLSGTSMASPIVAGTAALVWGQFPALTRAQLIARIVTNGKTITCGFAAATKRVDVRRAIFQTFETVAIGRVLDGANAKPPSPNTVPATVQVRSGTTVLGSDATNRGGSYEVFGSTLPGISRNLLAAKAGYVTDVIRSPLTVLSGVSTGPFTDAMSKNRPTGYFHGTADWKTTQPLSTAAGGPTTTGWDLDLGIRLPSGTLLPFGPAGDLTATPFVLLPRDSFIDLEPVEAFVIHPSAANGTYRVAVEQASGPSLNLNASLAQVRFFEASALRLGLNAPACTPALPVWHVANIVKSGTSYTVTSVNACVASFP